MCINFRLNTIVNSRNSIFEMLAYYFSLGSLVICKL